MGEREKETGSVRSQRYWVHRDRLVLPLRCMVQQNIQEEEENKQEEAVEAAAAAAAAAPRAGLDHCWILVVLSSRRFGSSR